MRAHSGGHSVTIQRRDGEITVGDLVEKYSPGAGTVEQAIEIEMWRRRPVAAAEFQTLDAESRRSIEHRIEIHSTETVGEHADLHADLLFTRSPRMGEANV